MTGFILVFVIGTLSQLNDDLDTSTFIGYSKCTMNGTQTITISELRQNAASAVNSVVSTQQPKVILQRSRPKAVLVDIDYFQALEEAVVELTDAAEAHRAKTEDKDPFSVYIKKRWGTFSS